ncbi:outer membrane lipid asymmetry maintenance protein MlaD [Lautropia dentalis]|jgi:mammalian cell entry related domain protein|uniref:Outer membrane lipid asymmetry maintenance protein MlaD n=1 Tax=Lautropia dentalis TaxID=2490857 RepID=A0A3R8NS94_9BURK|nr:outer membrane lipid asymmetry maintenance protein MlaD [Lautropia dentalis]RRN44663.1 outer membrane lipid asymmetry maintenance protein MlaD [Lautropia dentalis]
MQRKSMDALVGCFVLAGILALAFLAVRASSSASAAIRGGYELTANFDNIGGLKTRAAVRSAGVVVGRVTDITLDPQTYQAHVTMQMDSRFHFPKDSSLKIMTAGLLGEQYLGMEPGADTEDLEDGGKVEMTQSAIVLENLISQFLYGQAGKGQDSKDGAKGGE